MCLFLQSYPQHDDEGAEYLVVPGWLSAIWAVEPKRSYNSVGECQHVVSSIVTALVAAITS